MSLITYLSAAGAEISAVNIVPSLLESPQSWAVHHAGGSSFQDRAMRTVALLSRHTYIYGEDLPEVT